MSSGNKRSQENRRLEQEALALQAKNKSYALLESDDEGAGQLQVKPSKHKKSKKEKKSKREKHRYLTLPLHCKKPFKGPRLGIAGRNGEVRGFPHEHTTQYHRNASTAFSGDVTFP